MQLVELKRVVIVEPMLPAKFIEKKGDRYVEQEIKNKGEQHDNFVVVVKK